MQDVLKTVISQYGNSPRLLQLINNVNEYIDPSIDIDNFYDFVWNIETAVGFGLDIWGRIVGISRNLQLPDTPQFFGYSQALPGSFPFSQEPFFSGQAPLTNTYSLSDDYFRILILAKALSNLSATTVPAINAIMNYVFSGDGRFYCNDMGHMQMRYTFEFTLEPFQLAIITQTKIFPVPCGVRATVFNSPLPLFGFSEAGTITAAPFGQSVFLPVGALDELN
jgi:hypothetical protein